MQLRFRQLAGHLRAELAPIYLICGPEPYQLGEAAHQIRTRARADGFDERICLTPDSGFDWGELAAAADTMSLFCARRLIELRLDGKPGRDGAAALRRYCARLCPDNLLLILAPQLERKDLNTEWVKVIAAAGVLLQVWPFSGQELAQWIADRLHAAGLHPAEGVAALLAERAEGNQLAAAQEIEKLCLLHEPGALELDDLLGHLADSARFDLFALTVAAVAGDRVRVRRVLTVLQAEGTADALVLWALARELRILAQAANARALGRAPGEVLAAQRVPRPRVAALERALARLSASLLWQLVEECAAIDRIIKGQAPGSSWQRLAVVADTLCRGYPPFAVGGAAAAAG